MRVVSSVTVLLIFLGANAHGQQRDQSFELAQPQAWVIPTDSQEASYFSPAVGRREPMAQSDSADIDRKSTGNNSNEDQNRIRLASKPKNSATSVHSSVEPMYAFHPDNHFSHAPTEMIYEEAPSFQRHFFFGVDRDSCCDEWAGFCNCGGLKSNPGHLGLKWLRGNDQCEVTEGFQRKKCVRGCADCNQCATSVQNDCECSECQRGPRLSQKPKGIFGTLGR